MAILGDVLFPAADYRRTTLSLLSWWESRRLTFNVLVGATGLVSLAFIYILGLITPGIPLEPPHWMLVVAYGVLANVCYTFGWGVESAMQLVWKNRAPAIGPALFRQGLAFAVGLTALPMLIASMTWLARVASLVFHLR